MLLLWASGIVGSLSFLARTVVWSDGAQLPSEVFPWSRWAGRNYEVALHIRS
jgi:hypothetical protein